MTVRTGENVISGKLAATAPMGGLASSATRVRHTGSHTYVIVISSDGTVWFSISQHALRDFSVKTAPSLLNVKMVRAATPSLGAAAVHQGSAESFARMVSGFFSCPCTLLLFF